MAKTVPSAFGGDKDGELGDAAAGSDRYDVQRYDLDLKIDPGNRFIEGTVKMVFTSVASGWDDFVFDLRYNLNVDSVTHLSGPLTATHDADSVSVVLPETMEIGKVDSVIVAYSGFPREQMVINRGLMFKTHRRLPDGPIDDTSPIIANMSQPGYAQSWWPCKDKPGDKFLVSTKFTVPDTLIAVSNGTLESETPAEPGWRTWSWREAYPIATYLVSVAASDYMLLEESCLTSGLGSDVPLKHWVFLADVEAARLEFAPMCDMIDFCETRYGVYPFLGEKYGHAEILWPGAMEHQTVTSIGSASLDGQGTHDWLVMHELAHQWFGDSLTPETWADIWLNEGFATYAESLWFDYTEGFQAYLRHLVDNRNEDEWASQGPVYDPMPVFPGRVIYDKGAWILHSLRGRIGDAAFFSLMEDWATGPSRRDGTVVTQEFIDLAGVYGGEPLDAFFWPYLKETVLPQIVFDYEIRDGNAGAGTGLTVTLRQNQGPLFDNVFPLVVETVGGSAIRKIPLSTRGTTVEFEFPEAVTGVQLDPDMWVIWQEYAPGEAPQGLTNIYPNPSQGNYVVFAYQLAQAAQVEVMVMDARGARIFHQDLGTVGPVTEGNEFGWNVQTNAGARVPSGVYWVTVLIDGQRHVGKFAVIR